jgi:2-keto-4-pentenoate hydratase
VEPEDVARELSAVRSSGGVMTAPSERYSTFSIADGYAVGRLLHDELVGQGWRQVGLKLGFTNQRVWAQLGLDCPFWSPVYDRTVLASGDVLLEGLVAPRIEPEVVLGFATDLHRGASMGEICRAVQWAALGFEIVQCHFPSWQFKPADAIADAGLHGRLVVGHRVQLSAGEVPQLAEVDVELSRQNGTVERGRGANALGGPAQAIAWLLDLPGLEGLRAGEVVTTGTLTAAWPVKPGETWALSAAGPGQLGRLEVRFRG